MPAGSRNAVLDDHQSWDIVLDFGEEVVIFAYVWGENVLIKTTFFIESFIERYTVFCVNLPSKGPVCILFYLTTLLQETLFSCTDWSGGFGKIKKNVNLSHHKLQKDVNFSQQRQFDIFQMWASY